MCEYDRTFHILATLPIAGGCIPFARSIYAYRAFASRLLVINALTAATLSNSRIEREILELIFMMEELSG
jgi:hypothetical protein